MGSIKLHERILDVTSLAFYAYIKNSSLPGGGQYYLKLVVGDCNIYCVIFVLHYLLISQKSVANLFLSCCLNFPEDQQTDFSSFKLSEMRI